jgi:hypothetical protein
MHAIRRPDKLTARILIVVFSVFVASCTTIDTGPSWLIERIQNARTSADHMAIAQYYDRESKNARENAMQHFWIRESYQDRRARQKSGVGMLSRSEDLHRQFELLAVGYEELAALHRRHASELQGQQEKQGRQEK